MVPTPPPAGRLVWMDLEMTGLDPRRDRILEIATLVTDDELEVVAEGPELIVHQPDELLDGMDAWNTEHHGASGLTAASRASTVSEAEAEELTLPSCASTSPRAPARCAATRSTRTSASWSRRCRGSTSSCTTASST